MDTNIQNVPESIVFFGRRWFHKKYGNTIHTVTVYVNGVFLEKSIPIYGYGNQYIQTGLEILQKHGYFIGIDYHDFIVWAYTNHHAIFEVADVEAKKHL